MKSKCHRILRYFIFSKRTLYLKYKLPYKETTGKK